MAFVTFSKAAVPLRCWAVTEEAGNAEGELRAPRAPPAPANPSKDSFHQKPRRHEALPSSGSVQGLSRHPLWPLWPPGQRRAVPCPRGSSLCGQAVTLQGLQQLTSQSTTAQALLPEQPIPRRRAWGL